jgi:hypothetical protein
VENPSVFFLEINNQNINEKIYHLNSLLETGQRWDIKKLVGNESLKRLKRKLNNQGDEDIYNSYEGK